MAKWPVWADPARPVKSQGLEGWATLLRPDVYLRIRMYIHELTVRNYLIHRSTTIKLSPITVLIGPNGGGKSALFDAILNFSMLSRGSIRQSFSYYPYSYAATKHRGAAG
jgi:predicted ATPase